MPAKIGPAIAAERKNLSVARSHGTAGKADWSGATAVEFTGKNGLAGTIRLGWDADRSYLKLEAKSGFPLANAQKDDAIWNGACLEVCISTDPDADPSRLRFSSTDWQLGFATHDPTANLPERSWEWIKLKTPIPGAEVRSVAVEGGYALEVSFPWSALEDFGPKERRVLVWMFPWKARAPTGLSMRMEREQPILQLSGPMGYGHARPVRRAVGFDGEVPPLGQRPGRRE